MKHLLFLCFQVFFVSLAAQTHPSGGTGGAAAYADLVTYFRLPVDIPVSLSGNYGEFRTNHYHAGYDFRTGGVVGAKLYAVAEGFVSRIGVSPSGYGNVLYIEHPNGTTTVYGHMLSFAPEIRKFVKEQQYEKQSFSVDLHPTPEQFPVQKGTVIGLSGNSGSSGGPHLHFEVRNTETQGTLNYSAYGLFPVTDKIAPKLSRLQLYSYRLQSGIPQVNLQKSLDMPAPKTIIAVPDTFYVAMTAFDKTEGSNAFLALGRYEVYIDDQQVYVYTKGDVPTGQGRYVNTMLQYSQRVENNRVLLKTWVEPGNLLRSFVHSTSEGLFVLPDTAVHKLKIVLADDYNNLSTYSFAIRKQKGGSKVSPLQGRAMGWAMDNYFETPGLKVYLPMGALCKNVDFCAAQAPPLRLPVKATLYAPVWQVHTPQEALQKPMRLGIDASVPEALKDKAIIVSVDKDGSLGSAGGHWSGNTMETSLMYFGYYSVAIDTIPPSITPGFKSGADLRAAKQISFRIGDDLSGIESFNAYVDDQWVLFEYDAKSRRIWYTFDKASIGSGKKHQFELRVIDNCHNTRTFKTTFTW